MEREIKGEGEGELTVCRHPVRKPKAGNSYPAHPLKAENTHARIHLISYHTFLYSAHSGEKLVCICPQGAFNIYIFVSEADLAKVEKLLNMMQSLI